MCVRVQRKQSGGLSADFEILRERMPREQAVTRQENKMMKCF